ncbi:MAG: mucoidy inhibitor MuiA family protein [Pseudomonadota bacterium]
MRLVLSFSLSFLLLSAAVGAAELSTNVTSVVVYQDGATVTREAQVRLPAGGDTIQIVGLPPGLSVSDVRLAISEPSVRLGQVRVSLEPRNASFNDAYAAAERAVQEQQLVLQALLDEDEAARRELSFLQGFAEGYSGDLASQGNADPASWRSALVLLREGTEDARARLRDNTLKRTAAERELSKLKRELSQITGGERRESIVAMDVSSPRATTATLSLSYDTEDADWSSVYEARVDSANRKVRLLHTAQVGQSTGETWRGVDMTLSTRRIASGESLEWPDSEFVTLYEAARKQSRAGQILADGVEEIVVTGSRIAPSNSVEVSDFSVDYSIPGRVTLSSNADNASSFDIDSYDADIKLVTTVIPVSSTLPFLEGKFTHAADAPIQRSRVRVYLDGAFVGVSDKSYVRPGEETSVSLGEDPFVQVRILPQGDFEQKRGVLRRRQFETTHDIYELTNRRATPTTIEVYGRYPVSENRAVEVMIGDDATPPDQTDVYDSPGIVQWRRTLGGQESWRITHQYTISYPEDATLDRRFDYE